MIHSRTRLVSAVAIALLLVVMVPSLTVAGEAEAMQAALKAAEAWLELVDEGEYGASWEEAATLFRGAVEREDWEKKLRAVRGPLGELVSREVKSKQYKTSLPGAPDGEYVVIQFDTVFENKSTAVETVTPMLDEDGEWRVSGYYIR